MRAGLQSHLMVVGCVAAIGAVALLACNARQQSQLATPEQAETTQSLDSVRAAIIDLVGEPACSDAHQCRVAAFGAKPCGGPWSHLVYSIVVTDSAALERAVTRYNAREAELNRAEGRVSDCMLVARPSLRCDQGRCAAGVQ